VLHVWHGDRLGTIAEIVTSQGGCCRGSVGGDALALEKGGAAGDNGGAVCAPECAEELCWTGDRIAEHSGLGHNNNSTAGAGCMHAVCEHSEGKVGHKTYDTTHRRRSAPQGFGDTSWASMVRAAICAFLGGLEHRQRTMGQAALAQCGGGITLFSPQAQSEHIREGLANAIPALVARVRRVKFL
jgi:hypothetical protein